VLRDALITGTNCGKKERSEAILQKLAQGLLLLLFFDIKLVIGNWTATPGAVGFVYT
jgi:hypothetical protein